MTATSVSFNLSDKEFVFTDTLFKKLEDLASSQPKAALELLKAIQYLATRGEDGDITSAQFSISADSKIFVVKSNEAEAIFLEDNLDPKKLFLVDVRMQRSTSA
jgi:hypothetical protein